MKKLTVLLGACALFFAQFAAANAIVTSVSGNVQAAAGANQPRALRLGDMVRQGDTVVTGAASSVILRFEDGQVAALTSNSRMIVSAYAFDPQAKTGNVLLSLVDGGMRAITGLIGKISPQQVSYQAATATIGIRGTDVTIATSQGNVAVIVEEGSISFTFAGKTITVSAGEGVNAKADGTFQKLAATQIFGQLSPEMQAALNGLEGLRAAISSAAIGGIQPAAGDQNPTATGSTPNATGPGSSVGGGTPSVR